MANGVDRSSDRPVYRQIADQLRDVPAVALSGYAMEEDRQRALEARREQAG